MPENNTTAKKLDIPKEYTTGGFILCLIEK
jgi:hypothetical protein